MSPDLPEARRASALLLLAYGTVMGCLVWGFGWTWDDRELIVGGQLEPLLEALYQAWTGDFWSLSTAQHQHTSGMYRPLVLSSYALERACFGLQPGVAHVINLSLHLGVAGTAGLLARRLGGNQLLATALVLLHPHAAELVGSVSARTDLMATLGVLVSIQLRQGEGKSRATLAGLALLGACLSKEVALTGLGLWILVDVLEGRLDPRRWIPGVLAVGTALTARTAFVGTLDPDATALAIHPLAGAASTGWAIFDVLVPLPAGPWPAPHQGLLGWGCLLIIVLGWHRTRFLLLWCTIAWAPMAGWLPIEVRPSRALLYLPLTGMAIWAATSWSQRERSAQPVRQSMLVGATLLALVLGSMHTSALLHWRSPVDLWSWGVETQPDHPLTHLNLGRALMERGDPAAEASYREAARLAHGLREARLFISAASALGQLALERGDKAAARDYLTDAVRAAGPEHAPEALALLQALGPPPE